MRPKVLDVTMPGRMETVFGAEANTFFRLFNLHILQLAITLEDMEDRVRKHLEYVGFFHHFQSQNLSFEAFCLCRTSVLPMLEASTKSCITSSLVIFHLSSKTEIPIGRWLCFTWSFLLQRGSLQDKSCHLSVFWIVTCGRSVFLAVNLRQLWPCYTLLELVMPGSQIGCAKSDHVNMAVPWPDSGASGVLQICSPHVLLSRRADSSDYALDPG